MREIKFRVWDKEKKEFYTNHDIFIRASDGLSFTDNVLNYNTPNYEIEVINSDNFVFLQYTGVKDKDDVEIYEGDLIECDYKLVFREWGALKTVWELLEQERPQKVKYKIVFQSGEFLAINNVGSIPLLNVAINTYIYKWKHTNGISVSECNNFKVIGNIYQNSEVSGGNE